MFNYLRKAVQDYRNSFRPDETAYQNMGAGPAVGQPGCAVQCEMLSCSLFMALLGGAGALAGCMTVIALIGHPLTAPVSEPSLTLESSVASGAVGGGIVGATLAVSLTWYAYCTRSKETRISEQTRFEYFAQGVLAMGSFVMTAAIGAAVINAPVLLAMADAAIGTSIVYLMIGCCICTMNRCGPVHTPESTPG